MSSLICSVYFTSEDGRLNGHVTNAGSVFEAVRLAWDWFYAPNWQGPQPTLETVFDVQVSSRGKFLVTARNALKGRPLTPTQTVLFQRSDAFEPAK